MRLKKQPEEGEVFNKWIYNRMILQNKNILTATTGPTGSGKSYIDLRRAELWYQFYFKKPFPKENICFSVSEVMKRLSSGELKRGDLLILEEAGANLGSLDFQNKVSKVFTYVLQTFRSLNIGIFFNLPYLSMLNKQARMLIHAQLVTAGIDHQKKVSKCKAFFIQINQTSGKVYSKYLHVNMMGKSKKIKKFNYSLPSPELREKYESKKLKFVTELTEEFSHQLDELEKDKIRKMERPELSENQKIVYPLLCKGLTQKEIEDLTGIDQSQISRCKKKILEKGYMIEIEGKS